MNKKVKVSAPGKIILSGEHAVVYGHPAILTSLDRRLKVEITPTKKDLEIVSQYGDKLIKYGLKKATRALRKKTDVKLKIEIDSKIPVGSGMGSSAALAVALTAAFIRFKKLPWDLEKINSIAYEIEKKQHGNPSGGDNTIATYGGFLWFRKESEKQKIFSPIKIEEKLPRVFLIDTGMPKESTKEMVSLVRSLYNHHKRKVEKIFLEMEKVTKAFLRYVLKEKRTPFQDLLKENELLLEKLGVVSSSTRQIIRGIEKLGGAAKISGAGGKRGGSGIILAYHKNPNRLLSFAARRNLDIFSLKLGEEGVRIEKDN